MLSSFVYLIVSYIISQNGLEGANILVYLPTQFRSHFKPFEPLFVELAKRGHNITTVGMFPPEYRIENYNHLPIRDIKFGKGNSFAELRSQTRLGNYIHLHNTVLMHIFDLANDTNTRYILQSDTKFDLVMVELYHNDASFAFAGRFGVPIVGLSFQPLQPIYDWHLKNPRTFSYVPHLYLPYSDRMNFIQRLVNTVFGVITVLFYNFVSLSKHQLHSNILLQSANVSKISRIEDLTKNLSLILVESHFSAGYVKPHLPNVVEVAGIHIPHPQKLPQNLESFLNNSSNGVIYVSLGTLIEPDTINKVGIKFIEIFEKLPLNVIWKWDPKLLPRIPKNVLVQKWLPQADILRHPKCKLFVSHGGYHSIVESINGGVPILCMPFFTDQYHNAAIVEHYGIGKQTDIELSPEELIGAINQLLTNERYSKNVKLQSIIFKDRPISPLDLAVYWTEYIIRHKGAPHLKSAATELYWYQYLLLDVISFILIICVIVILVFRKCIQILRKSYSSLILKNKIKMN